MKFRVILQILRIVQNPTYWGAEKNGNKGELEADHNRQKSDQVRVTVERFTPIPIKRRSDADDEQDAPKDFINRFALH